jgi:hypothetical protein
MIETAYLSGFDQETTARVVEEPRQFPYVLALFAEARVWLSHWTNDNGTGDVTVMNVIELQADAMRARSMAQQAREFAELLPDPRAKARLEDHARKLDLEAVLIEAKASESFEKPLYREENSLLSLRG